MNSKTKLRICHSYILILKNKTFVEFILEMFEFIQKLYKNLFLGINVSIKHSLYFMRNLQKNFIK
jgi:hypothetical protein